MSLYRKKPVVIEAVQFDPQSVHKTTLPKGVHGCHSPGTDDWGHKDCRFWIDTLEGRMDVTPGDWIITGVKGERYPCKSDTFELTYEECHDRGTEC